MRATRYLAYLSAGLSFAYVVRAKLFGIPITLLEVLLLATLVAYLIEKRVERLPFPDPRRMAFFWPVVLLLLAATISVFLAPDRRAAAGIWKAYFVEPALVAYVVADVLRTRRHLLALVGGFFASGLVVSLLNIANFASAVASHRPQLIENPPVIIYNTPNATGLFLGPLLAIAAALILFGDREERRASEVFALVALPALILSFSRGAWLGLIVACAFLAYNHRRRLVLAAVGLGAIAAGLLVPGIRHRLAHEFDPSSQFNSVNTRRDLWKATYEMLRTGNHALLGDGLSGFKKAITPFKDVTGYREDLIYPHNLFLNFWTETGLLGLAAILWLALTWIWHSAGSIRARTSLHPYFLAFAAAGIAILVHGQLDAPFFKNDLAFLFMAILGMQVAAERIALSG